MKVKLILVLLIIAALSSCASMMAAQVDETMKSWLGASKEQLLLKWGPPTSIFQDSGNEIWSYESTNQTTGYAQTNQYGQTFYNAPQRYRVTRQFYINKENKIYAYRWQGI